MSEAGIFKTEVEKLLQGKDSVVLDMGKYRVLIKIIDEADEYDLDADLENTEIAAIIAEGYDDYRAGRVVDHEEVVRSLKGKYEKY